MTDWLNTKIVKDQQPAGPIVKSKKESGILTDGNSVDVYTDNGLRRIWLDSRIWLEGNPVANQDTIGVMSNPSNNSSVRFKLGADGNQELETSTGSLEFKPLSKNSPWFQKNLDRIREVISKASFNTDPEDEARWRSLYEAGGKVLKGDEGTKVPTALSGRNYWDGFKARNEALWDKVKNNTFVNMVFPVEEVSKGNTEAILPLIVPGGNTIAKTTQFISKSRPKIDPRLDSWEGIYFQNAKKLYFDKGKEAAYEVIRRNDPDPAIRQYFDDYIRTNDPEYVVRARKHVNLRLNRPSIGDNASLYKHGGRLIRQDGKIIEVPFENNKI